MKSVVRIASTCISVAGFVLLAEVLWAASNGALVDRVVPELAPGWSAATLALALSLPVPLHVISIGLIVQRRWLSPRWGRVAWVAIVTSGVWLGGALTVKLLLV